MYFQRNIRIALHAAVLHNDTDQHPWHIAELSFPVEFDLWANEWKISSFRQMLVLLLGAALISMFSTSVGFVYLFTVPLQLRIARLFFQQNNHYASLWWSRNICCIFKQVTEDWQSWLLQHLHILWNSIAISLVSIPWTATSFRTAQKC